MTKARCICEDEFLTPEEKWEHLVGTTYYGNLPQHKKHLHEGHCWCLCPYDINCPEIRTRHLLGLSDTDPLPIKVAHIEDGRDYFMKTDVSGVWGFSCTFDGCTHLTGTGRRYFSR